MAIYTQYGRFIKAKLFKEMLESSGDTYMLFGIGDSFWDDIDSGQSIPTAPYNTSALVVDGGQFKDINVFQNFIGASGITNTVSEGTPVSSTLIERCKNLLPPFPCTWKYDGDDRNLIYIGASTEITVGTNVTASSPTYVTQSNYDNFYIDVDVTTNTEHLYWFYSDSDNDIAGAWHDLGAIDLTIDEQPLCADQYYAELRLRGYALSAFSTYGYKAPAGLLGAVKCSVSFVKDIGSVENYTGEANQFWYGDRYWEIVDPLESDLDNYINAVSGDDVANAKVGQDYYPHYLLITSTVNPRQLCGDLRIDQKIIPRQIAIYTRKHDGSNLDGKISFSAADYMFNFGQLTSDTINSMTDNIKSRVLNFTLPCKVGSDTYPSGDFKFILHDYVRGTNRNLHSVSRFGYIVGF